MTIDSVMDALQKLKELSKVSRDKFLSDWKIYGTTLWYFYTLIQGLLDLSGKLIAKKGFRKPSTYADYIYVLAENGIIPDNKTKDFVQMAKFRNVLSHGYTTINLGAVYDFLQDYLGDAEYF